MLSIIQILLAVPGAIRDLKQLLNGSSKPQPQSYPYCLYQPFPHYVPPVEDKQSDYFEPREYIALAIVITALCVGYINGGTLTDLFNLTNPLSGRSICYDYVVCS